MGLTVIMGIMGVMRKWHFSSRYVYKNKGEERLSFKCNCFWYFHPFAINSYFKSATFFLFEREC